MSTKVAVVYANVIRRTGQRRALTMPIGLHAANERIATGNDGPIGGILFKLVDGEEYIRRDGGVNI